MYNSLRHIQELYDSQEFLLRHDLSNLFLENRENKSVLYIKNKLNVNFTKGHVVNKTPNTYLFFWYLLYESIL